MRRMKMKLLTKAIAFASRKHECQKRKGTDIPYIVHPLEALSIASTITNDENVLAAAVLHDVVEDCGVSIRQIELKFGKEVARLVAADTENKRENESAESTWKVRKQETLNHIEKMDKNSKIVVLADKLSNMRAIYRDYDLLGDELWQKFNCKNKDEQSWYYESIEKLLREDFKNEVAFIEYKRLINKVFNNKKWYEVLIRDEFIDYFSNEKNTFYKVIDGREILEPQFDKFKEIIIGITHAAGFSEVPFFIFEHMIESKPNMYLGYSYWTHYKILREGSLSKIWQSVPNGENRGRYEIEPEHLSAEQIAVLIMYPFWSRMGGSFETTFLDDGRLRKYLLALKKKHLEETKKDSDYKN